MKMASEQNASQSHHAPNGPRDLISRLYREIGISAVAAALEASSHAPEKPVTDRKEIPAVLRNEEAA